MTTPVSQTVSTDNTESTKNTKDNRKVFVAEHTVCLVYKIPDNLDLEDRTIVKSFWARYGILYIEYSSEEYFNQYYREDENTDFHINTDKCFVQKIQCYSGDDSDHLKYPVETTIENADEYDVEYEQDYEEDKEEVKKEEVVVE